MRQIYCKKLFDIMRNLLSLKTLADFINIMNGSSTLGDLIHDILDFIRNGFVFSSYFIKLKDSLIISRLYTEQLRRCITSLFLCIVKVHANAINLLLPFTNNAVKLFGLLLHR